MGIKAANLALRFLLELLALGALGYWGFRTGGGTLARVGLGIGAPLGAAVIWGVFGSPAAPMPVPEPWRMALELAIFGAAGVALYLSGQGALAGLFGLVAIFNRILMYVWRQ